MKPWIFDRASEIIQSLNRKDYPVGVLCLGDLADDWNQQTNLALYEETYDRAIEFAKAYPDAYWCWGNHDISYVWKEMETGYSPFAEAVVRKKLEELSSVTGDRLQIIHRIDNTIFSHGGITSQYVIKRVVPLGIVGLDNIIEVINTFGRNELWNDDSPLWDRPQYHNKSMYKGGFLQVVGHTPVSEPEYDSQREVLSLDTFSTYYNSLPIGDQRFVVVNTVDKSWKYADEI